MKLWLIAQTENTGYDTFDSAVVAAETEAEAQRTQPAAYCVWGAEFGTWASDPSEVKVKYLGEAAEGTEPGTLGSVHCKARP